ncbi:MAG: molybdopterin-dependent oxidoreductase [Candidatus Krumholzibacteria bacterium]|nr:molybdopterin-dependent oxidoreductase [Candidatus Krumholzibacteria bacterium]
MIRFTLNGKLRALEAREGETLLDLLRRAGCKSVKFSDEKGEGGADTILLDGEAVSSVNLLPEAVEGRGVETLEGLLDDAWMQKLQSLFLSEGAVQCGYCTPAMLLCLEALRRKNPSPDEEAIRKALSPVLCRCTGYVKPLRAAKVCFALSEPREPADNPKYQVLGHDTERLDGRSLVEGRPVFAEDRELLDPIHLKILFSPHPHARIREVDTREALALPGVLEILDWRDVPRRVYTTAGQGFPEPSPYDSYMLDKKVRHVGDRVALVLAESEQAATEALKKIRVDYEILPAFTEAGDAMEDSAPTLHEEKAEDPQEDLLFWPADRERNLAAETELEIGDSDEGFAKAETIIEREYQSHSVQQCSIEPHVMSSWLDGDGRLVIESASQVPFHVRRVLSRLLDFPLSRIRVMKPRIGGGFGGKQEILGEELCALVTLRTGRPARLRFSREEELISARNRHASAIQFRAGFDRNAKLSALEMNILENTGANGAHSLTVMSVSAQKALSLYPSPAIRHRGHAVYSNRVPAGAYRGYGVPQAYWALESFMDECAGELGVDRIELRRRNLLKVGDSLKVMEVMGEGREGFATKLQSGALDEILRQGQEAIEWDQARSGEGPWKRGVGMALVMQGSGIPGIDMASVFLRMNEDGSFHLQTGATDLGTGSDTVLAQIAAETLGVGIDKIRVISADTDTTPFDTGAYGSSTTYISGGAVKKAAEQLREDIRSYAAELLECESDELRFGDQLLEAPDGRQLTFEEIGRRSFYTDQQRQLMACASYSSLDSPPPFAAQFADISVNVKTGEIRVEKFVTALDVGTVLNPPMAEGQVEGAVIQGIGFALKEEVSYDEGGAPRARTFMEHGIYRADEVPEQEVIFVEDPDPTGPYGAKAVAEICISGPAPAIANALFDACGVRIRETPLRPDNVLAALDKVQKRSD